MQLGKAVGSVSSQLQLCTSPSAELAQDRAVSACQRAVLDCSILNPMQTGQLSVHFL